MSVQAMLDDTGFLKISVRVRCCLEFIAYSTTEWYQSQLELFGLV